MKLYSTKTFTDSLLKLTRREQKAVKKVISKLQLDPANPNIQFQKLRTPKASDLWSVRVNNDIRLIIQRTDNKLLLHHVAHHDAAYGWAKQQIEQLPKIGDAQLIEVNEQVEEETVELILRTEHRQVFYFTESLINGINLDMILVEGSEFEMGSPDDEPQRSDDEGPQHLVNVPSFFMGRYPVTQAQWQAVTELPKVEQELDPDPSNFKGNTLPVEQVSWYDAVEFCQRLSIYTKRTYRLPSEAEWEYVCRAGTTTPFYFGAIITPEVVNYNGNSTYNNSPTGEYRVKTTPVDHFEFANAWGLSDMHGNVWEWCQDHWHSNYEGAPTDGSAWLSNDEDARRVIRGGSWDYYPRNCRSATRDIDNPRETSFNIGFRLVCSFPRALS